MVLKLLEMRRVSVSGLITHRFPLAQAGEGKAVRDEPRERGCTQNHELRALESICKDAGYSTNLKMVLTSAGSRRADLEVLNIRVAQQTDLLIDVTLRHDFIGAGRYGGSTRLS
jgi:hypothetical protein